MQKQTGLKSTLLLIVRSLKEKKVFFKHSYQTRPEN